MLTVQRHEILNIKPTTQRIQLFDSKFPAVFHCQKVTDHSPCLPHFLLLNAESKSSSRTDEICHYDCHVKFENNTSGRAQLWDTALKFLCPGLSITSPDHLGSTVNYSFAKHYRAIGKLLLALLICCPKMVKSSLFCVESNI